MNKQKKQDEKNSSLVTTKEGGAYEIPPEGSLGLLALGYRGLTAWRERRNAYFSEQFKQQQSSENK